MSVTEHEILKLTHQCFRFLKSFPYFSIISSYVFSIEKMNHELYLTYFCICCGSSNIAKRKTWTSEKLQLISILTGLALPKFAAFGLCAQCVDILSREKKNILNRQISSLNLNWRKKVTVWFLSNSYRLWITNPRHIKLNIPLERKCVREDPSVGDNVLKPMP